MGAINFGQIVVVKGDARDAYRKAREYANEYNGHREGYSGDIQTTSGFSYYTNTPRYGTKKFWKWENEMLDELDKWGNAGCVEVKGQTLKRLKETGGYKGKKGIRAFYFFGWGAE